MFRYIGMGLFKRLFKKHKNIEIKSQDDLNLGNIKIYDDVIIKINNCEFPGWVYGKTSQKIHIVFTNQDSQLEYAEFTIERPLNRKEITENNITLIL